MIAGASRILTGRLVFVLVLATTLVMSVVLAAVVTADLTAGNRQPVALTVTGGGATGTTAGPQAAAGTAPQANPAAPGAAAAQAGGASSAGSPAGAVSSGGAAATGSSGSGGAATAPGAATGGATSGGPTAQAPPVPADEETQGVTPTSITVGAVITQSGVADLTPYLHGVQAYFQKVNAAGGVNGRQINLVSADDGSSPSRGLEELNAMEQQDHIFATVSECAPLTDSSARGLIDQHGLPSVGICTWPTAMNDDPYVYPFGLFPNHLGMEMGKWALDKLNPQQVGMISEDESVIQDFADGVRSWWSQHGHAISGAQDQKSPIGAPDYSTYVQNFQNAHVTTVAVLLTESDTIGFCKAANQAGYHPDWVGLTGNDPAVAVSGQCEGLYGWSDRDDVSATTAAMQEFRSDMATYEPDEQRLPQAEQGYEPAKNFVYALRQLGSDVTRTRLMSALNSLRNYDDGFQPPFSFTYGKVHERSYSAKWYVIKNNQVVIYYDRWYYLD